MEIYSESTGENAALFYPNEEPGVALTMAEQAFGDYLREDFFKVQNAFYGIWMEDDFWISALRLEPFRDGLLLEALETHPEHRGKGYAKKLVKAVLQDVSLPVYSHVLKDNLASLAVHRACGFQIHKDCAVYVDGSVSHKAYTLRYLK